MTSQPEAPTFINPSASSWTGPAARHDGAAILAFHRALPHYTPTPLVSLPAIASSLGIAHLVVKDESHRLSLPSFKILGASWAIQRTLTSRLSLPLSAPLNRLGSAAREANVQLVTCSDGNWGRAVARMAKLLGIRATVYVPQDIDDATRAKIASEGAECEANAGDYDAAIARAKCEAGKRDGAVLVMDTSWDGFVEIPQWVTDGYSTLLHEVDLQLPLLTGTPPTLVIASVGVGSWAHSVVAHYKAAPTRDSALQIATVEPRTAASFNTALHAGSITTIPTTYPSIMCGMNCGTTSAIAWDFLSRGVDVSLAVSDWEAHQAVLDLQRTEGRAVCQEDGEWVTSPYRIKPGPCGAAPLAALQKGIKQGILKLGENATVVLFCTEGEREYIVPQKD